MKERRSTRYSIARPPLAQLFFDKLERVIHCLVTLVVVVSCLTIVVALWEAGIHTILHYNLGLEVVQLPQTVDSHEVNISS